MPSTRRSLILSLLFVSASVAAIGLHAIFVPRHFPGNTVRAAPYLVVGWIFVVLAFYAAGRLLSSPGALPSMRAADVGTALVLVSLLLSLGLDLWGFTPARIVEVYLALGVALYAGLALVGWALGQRSKAIDRIEREE